MNPVHYLRLYFSISTQHNLNETSEKCQFIIKLIIEGHTAGVNHDGWFTPPYDDKLQPFSFWFIFLSHPFSHPPLSPFKGGL